MQAMQSVISLGTPGQPGQQDAPAAVATAPDPTVPRRRQANGTGTVVVVGQPQQLQGTASSSSAQNQNHPDRRYKCSFCARAFSRSEHKNRHERSRELQIAGLVVLNDDD
ncbi:hypothetical protein V1517DRAFT_109992 [Lipomyces orientalis]|uniref:Uncharacterized protein n=1 Tax=Lipomyces orientalis TaxID=1233043 RepID=A0ACC3TPT1_9ASCO